MARAICGKALPTAAATVASSVLMRQAISRDDLQSRSLADAFACSVRRRQRSDFRAPVGFKLAAFQIWESVGDLF